MLFFNMLYSFSKYHIMSLANYQQITGKLN